MTQFFLQGLHIRFHLRLVRFFTSVNSKFRSGGNRRKRETFLLLSRELEMVEDDYLRMLRLTLVHGPIDSRHSIN